MKKHFRQTLSLIMSLIMIMSIFAGLNITSLAKNGALGEYVDILLTEDLWNCDIGDELVCNIIAMESWNEIEYFEGNIFLSDYENFDIINVSSADDSLFSSLEISENEDGSWSVSGNVVNSPATDTVLFTVTTKAIETTETTDGTATIPLHIRFYYNNDYSEDYSCVYLPYVKCPHENVSEHEEIPATCEGYGHSAGQRCVDCNTWVSGNEYYPTGHLDYDKDLACDNCSNKIISIKLTADKTEINPDDTFTVTVSFENAKGLKNGSVQFAHSWNDEYEVVDYKFNENLTYSEYDRTYDFSFNEPVQSDSVDIVTVTYKTLKNNDFSMWFYGGVSDFVLKDTAEVIDITVNCPHSNTTEHPEKAPGCTTNGYTAGVQCNNCGNWISGHESIAPLGSHVDENKDNFCDVCGERVALVVGENIIRTDSGINTIYFTAEKAGIYKFEYSTNLSFGIYNNGYHSFDYNNLLCFAENETWDFAISTSHYNEETYVIKVTLIDDSATGHYDKNYDRSCDNCSRTVKTEYMVDFNINGSEAVLTKGKAICEIQKGSIPQTDGGGNIIPYEKTSWTGSVNNERTWLYPYYATYDENNIYKYAVTEISEGAFIEFDKMQYIVIPPTVKTIGDYAVGYTAKSAGAKIDNFVIYGCKNSVAQTYAEDNGFEFKLLYDYEIKNNEVIITSVCDLLEIGSVATEIDGYPVTTIGENCFADRNFDYLYLPENITTIKAGAFRNNPNLGEYGIQIHNTLKTIEAGAFDGCGIIDISYYGTPAQWNEISIGKNNDSFRNAKVFYCGTGHKDFYYVIENDSVIIEGVNYEADFNNLVVPETLDGYPVTEIAMLEQNGSDTSPPDYYQITIPASVTSIREKSIGYFNNWSSDEISLIPDFKIIGVPGSYAETYANENGITFIAVEPEEPPVDEPPVEEPPVPSDDSELKVKNEGGIVTDSENKIAQIGTKETAETLLSMIENASFAIVDKNGNVLDEKALVGTGAKIQILDKDGNVVNEYTVLVPTDIDGNGKTTAADARLALRASAKIDNLEGVYAMAADVTADGKTTASDARQILRISAGLEK